MKKVNCQYAIVRFLPFVETGEFANTGVVLIAPDRRVFEYRLQKKRYKRYTDFFDDMPKEVFVSNTQSLERELKSLRNLLMKNGFDRRFKNNNVSAAFTLFNDLVRPRDGFIRYSQPRNVLTDDPKKACDDLFKYYVERDFTKNNSPEVPLERHITSVLKGQGLLEFFHNDVIGDNVYHARFPFVHREDSEAISAIKAINLNQPKPSKIIDHGGHWVYRIRELKQRQVLPDEVLFAYQSPKEEKENFVDMFPERQLAFRHVHAQLENLGVKLIEYDDDTRLIEFASYRARGSFEF